ncbi:hypothetical protein [Azospirillum canadense]|uniref:hypothetical protein n=1 Tax=Azospirillum canadense TaxID=403962 RepID=UPI0022276333|nr:hypothetical protein [Azospirillum canadense]
MTSLGFQIYQANVEQWTQLTNPGPLSFSGTAGNDAILGSTSWDWLSGEAGSDYLGGGLGGDILYSSFWSADTPGSFNVLEGGADNDAEYGDRGMDLFVFGTASGQDVIHYFDPTQDYIVIEAGANGSNLNSAADLAGCISDRPEGTFIDFGAGNSITLVDTPSSALLDANFLFVEVTATGPAFV